MLKTRRKVALLALVEELTSELKELEFPHKRADRFEQGLPKSVLGHVVARLEADDDLATVKNFVQHMSKLDRMVAQNQRNPSNHFEALQEVLKPWFKEQPHLSRDEWLYVLAWTQRHLPSKSVEKKKRFKPQEKGNTSPNRGKASGPLGNQFKGLAGLAEKFGKGDS